MNFGPIIFLAALFALGSSWFGLVLKPQMQVGQLQATNVLGGNISYPLARSGMARQGLQIYRANGCAYCHTQQVLQQATTCDVVLTDAGTNQAALLGALAELHPGMAQANLQQMTTGLPKPVLKGMDRPSADRALKTLTASGAKASLYIVPLGPDIARGWGKRRSVAEDFLFDDPVMLGSERIGPDLANVGLRLPDAKWHYQHLFSPQSQVETSTMPPYRFLFEKRRIQGQPSPEAVRIEGGYEIVPGEKARTLVAYLLSLRAGPPLFIAPYTVPAGQGTNAAPANGVSTNAPPVSGTTTNSTSTNAPTQ